MGMGRKVEVGQRFPDSTRQEAGEKATFIRDVGAPLAGGSPQYGEAQAVGYGTSFKDLEKMQAGTSGRSGRKSGHLTLHNMVKEIDDEEGEESNVDQSRTRTKSKRFSSSPDDDSSTSTPRRRAKLPGSATFLQKLKVSDMEEASTESPRKARGSTTFNQLPSKASTTSPRKSLPRGKTFSNSVPFGDNTPRRKKTTTTFNQLPSKASTTSPRKPLPRGKTFSNSVPFGDNTPRRKKTTTTFNQLPSKASTTSPRKPLPRGKTFSNSVPFDDNTPRRKKTTASPSPFTTPTKALSRETARDSSTPRRPLPRGQTFSAGSQQRRSFATGLPNKVDSKAPPSIGQDIPKRHVSYGKGLHISVPRDL